MSEQSLTEKRIADIRERLNSALNPEALEIVDQSHLHAGHAGAKSGKGHFDVRIVSHSFKDCKLIARHRQVYAALGDLMDTEIHALAIQALSPEEL